MLFTFLLTNFRKTRLYLKSEIVVWKESVDDDEGLWRWTGFVPFGNYSIYGQSTLPLYSLAHFRREIAGVVRAVFYRGGLVM